MNCQEVQERLSEYLEQSLDDASIRTSTFISHRAACAALKRTAWFGAFRI